MVPRNRMLFSVALWGCLLAVVTPCRAEARNRRIKFRGRLMDQFGDPVPNATMQFGAEVESALIKMPFGIGRGPFTVETDRDGFFRVSIRARSCWFDEVRKEGFKEHLIGAQDESRPGVVYYYVRRFFPADVLCIQDAARVAGTDLTGAVYTYYNSWAPYQYILPAGELP